MKFVQRAWYELLARYAEATGDYYGALYLRKIKEDV